MTGIFGPVTFILPDLLLAFQEDREVPPVAGGELLRGREPGTSPAWWESTGKHHDI